ncbi:hypothetical protein QR680_017418 [Steinernema hermaphroditum]|uniref:Reverse transcriptase domain-containing protein n=1 Tax=Steinernema hermaphroditum TaxID=289476 RepID=A0AA39HFH1_9BILA|nr:hypothetical protein QR680_017418 [Steinernema hermaphroditum]
MKVIRLSTLPIASQQLLGSVTPLTKPPSDMGDILFDGERKGVILPLFLRYPPLQWQQEAPLRLAISEVKSHGIITPPRAFSPAAIPDFSTVYSPKADEEEHGILRQRICDVIASKNADWIVRWTGRKEDGTEYLIRSMMRQNGIWMGEIELQAAAEFLGCHIIVYSDIWQRYNPDYSLGNLNLLFKDDNMHDGSFPEDGGSSYRSMSSKSPRFRSESSHSETKEERQRSRERASRTPSNRNGKSSSPDIPDAPKIEVRTADQGVVLKSRQLDQFLKSVRGEHVSRKQRQELLDQLPRVQHLAAVAPFVDTALASSNTNQSAVVPVKALVDNHRLFMAIANQAAIASAGIEKGASLSKITPYLDWISKIASWGIQEATAARRMAAIASATRKDPQLVMPNLKVAPLAVEESMSTSAGEMGVPLFGSALLKEAREKAGDSDFGQVIRKLEKRSREGSRPSRAQSSRYSQSFRSRYDSLLDQVYDSSPSSKRPSFVAIKSACQAGRLADFVQNWAQLTSDKWILSTIQGYKLEFSRRPSRSVHVSNARKFSLCQQNAILDEIASLLDKRAIVKVKDGANLWFSNVFLVPKKDGGNRPVINLRPLNKFIRARHFKMESISMLRSLLLPDDWLAKLDMKDAYFGVPIAASDRKWLCFKFNGSTYQFRALPFGLSSAPYVYSKVMRVVATHLRQLGLRLIVYLDDWLFLNESKKGLVQDLKVVRSVFAHLGLIINEEKSSQTPSRTLEFLGFIVNAMNAAGEDHPLSYRTDFRLVLWRIYRMSGGLLGFPKEQRKRYLTLGRRPLEANTIHQLKDFLTGVSVNR